LGAEVRQVAQTPRRLVEAARLGFSQALVPERGPEDGPLWLRRVRSVACALDTCLQADASQAPRLRVVRN
jgi:predicted ATP-dependent serine protease